MKIRNKQIRYIKKKCRRFQYLRRFLRVVTFLTFLLLGASGLCNVDQQNNWTSMIPIKAPLLSMQTSRTEGPRPDTSPVWAENEKIRYIIRSAGKKDKGFSNVINIFMALI